jgi:Uma2 family endonuclease
MRTAFSEIDSLDVKVKPNGKMTYEEFLDWCDEDTWAEWVNGEIIMLHPTTFKHHLQIYLTNDHMGDEIC